VADYLHDDKSFSVFCWFILALGMFEMLCYLWRMMRSLGYYICRPRNLNTYAKYGNGVGREIQENRTWALVTGASDGLGLSYCHELASRGFNIILLSRTKSKLEKVAAEIKGVKTEIYV
jgi:17beta-estradiol 17-dehydrogenase / very-long-chain 3-oxoacyl-CoA reductase